MFQKGHGQKNFFAIKTAQGFYAAGVAGLSCFVETGPRLFDSSADATEFYKRSLARSKRFRAALPTEFEVVKVKLSEGRDRNV